MFKPREKQSTFFDATYICEKLIPKDSFYRKFREIVWPIIDDEQFATLRSQTESGRDNSLLSLDIVLSLCQYIALK
jgi:hypothetical protein